MDLPPKERERLKGLREKLEWRQEDLAAKIGVSPATISNLETARHGQVYKAVYAEVVRVLKAGNATDPGADRFRRVVQQLLDLDERGWAVIESVLEAQPRTEK